MMNFRYLLEHFFTHKDFLAPPHQIPGTLFTPLHLIFAAILLAIVIGTAVYVGKHQALVRPVFIGLWITLVVLEVAIVTWESLSARHPGFDLQRSLSLYPCSIYLYAMPLAIWGKGVWKKIGCGYVCTLGLLGGAVNFFYPAIRLSAYSCISFVGFHTFFYHAALLFTCLVMLISGYHRYTRVTKWWELLLPCVLSLIVSVPANIVNYSPIGADYMFFRGKFPLLALLFPGVKPILFTLVLYGLYIVIPALFYLPSYLRNKRLVPA